MAKDSAATWKVFHEAVNMTAGELESWLQTDESKDVGDKSSGGESTGHASGRRIVSLLRSKKEDLTDKDYGHMRKVVGTVHRHLAHLPSGDITDSAWRYCLMNWGHDPCKKSFRGCPAPGSERQPTGLWPTATVRPTAGRPTTPRRSP
jgi:Protein of unknown function (DUF3140)